MLPENVLSGPPIKAKNHTVTLREKKEFKSATFFLTSVQYANHVLSETEISASFHILNIS